MSCSPQVQETKCLPIVLPFEGPLYWLSPPAGKPEAKPAGLFRPKLPRRSCSTVGEAISGLPYLPVGNSRSSGVKLGTDSPPCFSTFVGACISGPCTLALVTSAAGRIVTADAAIVLYDSLRFRDSCVSLGKMHDSTPSVLISDISACREFRFGAEDIQMPRLTEAPRRLQIEHSWDEPQSPGQLLPRALEALQAP